MSTNTECLACRDLEQNAPGFLMNGLSAQDCVRLTSNRGLANQIIENWDNCQTLEVLVDCLIGRHGQIIDSYDLCDIKEWLRQLMINLHELLSAWKCNECGQWNEINNIWTAINSIDVRGVGRITVTRAGRVFIVSVDVQDILDRLDDLEEALRQLLTGSTMTLVRGEHYDLIFHNGFITASGDIQVRAAINPFSTSIIISTPSIVSGTALIHQQPQTIVTEQQSEQVVGNPASWAFSINFLGRFAPLNTRGTSSTPQQMAHTTVVPSALQAHWQCSHVLANMGSSPPRRVIIASDMLQDGFGASTFLFARHPGVEHLSGLRFNRTMNFVGGV